MLCLHPKAEISCLVDMCAFLQGLTNLRSVTWTKVSLKEAKIRATPKTSSPVKMEGLVSH